MARDRAERWQAQAKAKDRSHAQLVSFGWGLSDRLLNDRSVGRRANHGSFRTPEPWRAEARRCDRPVLSRRAAIADSLR